MRKKDVFELICSLSNLVDMRFDVEIILKHAELDETEKKYLQTVWNHLAGADFTFQQFIEYEGEE